MGTGGMEALLSLRHRPLIISRAKKFKFLVMMILNKRLLEKITFTLAFLLRTQG
jgi:hypothetical protein